jgi:hypothetical protein
VLELPGSQARGFLAMLRRCRGRGGARRDPFVIVRGPGAVSLEAVLDDGALRLAQPGPRGEQALALSASAVAKLAEVGAGPVALEEAEPGRGRASWSDGECDFATVRPDPHLTFPALPRELADPGPGFLEALREVSETAPAQVAGRAIDRVLLQGKTGRLVGTDGRQLLAWGGFRFPWADDVLVPRRAAGPAASCPVRPKLDWAVAQSTSLCAWGHGTSPCGLRPPTASHASSRWCRPSEPLRRDCVSASNPSPCCGASCPGCQEPWSGLPPSPWYWAPSPSLRCHPKGRENPSD